MLSENISVGLRTFIEQGESFLEFGNLSFTKIRQGKKGKNETVSVCSSVLSAV